MVSAIPKNLKKLETLQNQRFKLKPYSTSELTKTLLYGYPFSSCEAFNSLSWCA